MTIRRSRPRGDAAEAPAEPAAAARLRLLQVAAARLRPLQVAAALDPATPTQILIRPAGSDAPTSGRRLADRRNQSDIARFVNDRLSVDRPR